MRHRRWWFAVSLTLLIVVFAAAFIYLYLQQMTPVTGTELELRDIIPVDLSGLERLWQDIRDAVKGIVNKL
ncbi:hypothetical protein [Massiliimalia massiliensis]|uniref:hypothetical protein n=1 Tax=Massiliimalia massiliensis TaxID=1852384 RepID=UPI001179CC90|nr:hypothetical protein [Massiliimalia massiliensis]